MRIKCTICGNYYHIKNGTECTHCGFDYALPQRFEEFKEFTILSEVNLEIRNWFDRTIKLLKIK